MIARRLRRTRRLARRAAVALLVLVTAGILTGCTEVRPTIKIGVLAPFEGLHRRSGYAALDAVRAAIREFPDVEAGVLPLALDDGAEPEQGLRSAQMLLADARVVAVVGPLSPDVAAAVAPLLPPEQFAWYAPYSIAGPDWAQGLIRAAAELAKEDEATALVLAGGTQGWPELDETQWTSAVGFPVRLADDPQDVERGEAVFWLGSAEDGAAYLADLRRLQPQALFALGPAGEDPVFVERYLARAGSLDRVYWTTWTDAGYTDWTAVQLIQSPNAYLAYRAAQAALLAATAHDPAAPPPSWVVQTYRFDPLGNWSPAN